MFRLEFPRFPNVNKPALMLGRNAVRGTAESGVSPPSAGTLSFRVTSFLIHAFQFIFMPFTKNIQGASEAI